MHGHLYADNYSCLFFHKLSMTAAVPAGHIVNLAFDDDDDDI